MNPRLPLFCLLAFAYAWLLQLIPTFGWPRWQFVAMVNSALALLTFILIPSLPLHRPGAAKQLLWHAPGPLLIAACLGWGVWKGVALVMPARESWVLAASLCLWIPLVEELLFRRVLLKALGEPSAWTIYGSALIFALAHTAPPGQPWPPLGPFLLGIATALVYVRSGRLTAAILLHGCCNATGLLLEALAPDILAQLQVLYQSL